MIFVYFHLSFLNDRLSDVDVLLPTVVDLWTDAHYSCFLNSISSV